jgi:CRP-like cAMP-binding protein
MFKSFLNKSIIANSLQENELSQLFEKTTNTQYKKGQLVFHEDSMPFGIYVLHEGMIKLYKTGTNGKKQIFQLCKPGDIFGFHAVLNDYAYPDSAETISDCKVEFIPKLTFINLVKKSSSLSFNLLQSLSEEFREFIDQETMLSQKSVRERVALVLFELHDLFKSGAKSVITLSRSDLADLCGTVKETLVRTLSDFKEEELIIIVNKHDIELINVSELNKIARK